MPSGAKKRKAAKKKKSSTTNSQSHQGNTNGGELNSPTSQYQSVEKIEDKSSENKSKDINQKLSSSNGTSSSSSSSSGDESNIIEKNVLVLEPVPETISPIVDPVNKPVDSLLDEVSQVFDEMQNQKKKELVVVSEAVVNDDCLTSRVVVEPVLKENEVEKFVPVDEQGCLVLKDDVASSTGLKDSISEVNRADRVNESETVGDINKQAQEASSAVAVQRTTTWKSCCGIFELFSGSER